MYIGICKEQAQDVILRQKKEPIDSISIFSTLLANPAYWNTTSPIKFRPINHFLHNPRLSLIRISISANKKTEKDPETGKTGTNPTSPRRCVEPHFSVPCLGVRRASRTSLFGMLKACLFGSVNLI